MSGERERTITPGLFLGESSRARYFVAEGAEASSGLALGLLLVGATLLVGTGAWAAYRRWDSARGSRRLPEKKTPKKP